MKIASIFKVLFLLFLSSGFLQAQNIIYSENFNDDVGKGNSGGILNLSGVEWTLNTDNCTIEEGDYVKVISIKNNGRFEALHCRGEAIWKSPMINISAYENIDISIYVKELGSSTSKQKFVKLYYKTDLTDNDIIFPVNGSNEGNFGEKTATVSELAGNQLYVTVKLNSHLSTNKVYIDDVVVRGTLKLVTNDQLVQVQNPLSQISSQQISSMNIDENSAQALLKFKLVEPTGADNLDTKIASIKFKNIALSNSANLSTQFSNFFIYDGSRFINTSSVNVSAGEVTLNFKEGEFSLLNGTSQEYELRAYLNTSEIVDGKNVQLLLGDGAAGITAYASGSNFDILNSMAVSSPEHQISVIATQLNFSPISNSHIIKNNRFSVSAYASDYNNNIDNDVNQSVNLSLVDGKGNLSGTLTKRLTAGMVDFDDLSYNNLESIKLIVSADGFSSKESDLIHILPLKSTSANIVDWVPESFYISSVLVSDDKVKEVFRFQVTDQGDDKIETVLKTIKLVAGDENTMNWLDDIAGFQLKIDGNIIDIEPQVSESSLLIKFQESELLSHIPDGESIDLSLLIFLPKKSSEGAIFQAAIDPNHAQWEVSGSHLQDKFVGKLKGNSFMIEVEGTTLFFSNKPSKNIIPKADFGFSVKLADFYGNIDLNSAQKASVSLASGSGVLTSNKELKEQFINGTCVWANLQYDKAENFTLLIEVDGLEPILSDNISSLDINSTILPSSINIQSRTLNPLCVNAENSEMVFHFIIKDELELDVSPTRVSSMTFYNVRTHSALDWKKHLAGAVIKRDGKIVAKTTKIEDESIVFSSTNIEIENGKQDEFELAVYFKKSLIPDHASLQVEIKKDHQWKTASLGSSFVNELDEIIKSPRHYVNVNADRFSFISYPIGIEKSEKFNLTIAAVDAFQNIDLDKNLNINLNIKGDNLAQSEVFGNLENGILEFHDLSVLGNQSLKITASGKLKTITKELFVQNKRVLFSDNFEYGDLNAWEHTEAWIKSPYKPIKGFKSLKHNLSNAIGSSCIVCPLSKIDIGAESIFWEFTLHNSDWDPTSSNFFVFHLLMDSNDLEKAETLYSVGINLSGSNDLLSLWKTENENLQLLVKSEFDWNKDETIAIKVTYNAKGEWLLSYNRLGDKTNWLALESIVSEVKHGVDKWYSGLQFNFSTPLRAGQLWLDNVEVKSYNTAPFIKNYKLFSDSIVLNFSENLNFLKSSELKNFELKRGDQSVSIKECKPTNLENQLVLIFKNTLVTGTYNLQVNKINDLKGAIADIEFIQFNFYEDVKKHDLVINEIFADESPIIGLPEYEFIEIYNTSNHPINLENFKLKVGRTEKRLNKSEILSHEYLILCSNAAIDAYKKVGHVVGISSFPGLINSGTSISIESEFGMLIDQITYNLNWYGDENKKDGGWSLERIDVTNYSWQADNWSASTNNIGGTPGKQNSIWAYKPDLVKPKLLRFELFGSNSIDLYFSETINIDQALNIQNYSLNDEKLGKQFSIIELDDELFAIRLKFFSDFETNKPYKLILSTHLVDLAENPLEDNTVEFILLTSPHDGDVVINEVLFNPYSGGADYVELLNISDRKIDVKEILIANRDEDYQLNAIYPISEKSRIWEAGAYLLLSVDTANIKLNYSHFDESTFIQLAKMPSFNDDKGRVVILTQDKDQLDDFAYNEEMHFSQLITKEGISLERINPNKETNLNSNWISASQTANFGTPGMQNSSYNINELAINEIGFKSKIFSPDNDGIDDRLLIYFDLEKSGYVANIRIYNSYGKEVRRLASNLTLSTKDELFWDGLLANKELASIGVYVIYIELYHPDGDVKTYKKTCVLAGRFK